MIALVAAAGLLVACGGDDDTDESEPASEPAEEAAPEPADEPAGEPADEPAGGGEVIEDGEVYFLREGVGQVVVSLSDGTMFDFDTTCGVYIDPFEETYEHAVDDGTFQFYFRRADDGGAGSMGILLGEELTFSATVPEQFRVEANGNNFDASVDGRVPGVDNEVTVQVQSVCDE